MTSGSRSAAFNPSTSNRPDLNLIFMPRPATEIGPVLRTRFIMSAFPAPSVLA